jgi:4'-phosphopantetheinyl transferase
MSMNPADAMRDVRDGELEYPALLEWDPQADLPELAPHAVSVWLIDLDAGLAPGEDPQTAEPGPELALLCSEEQGRAARFVRASDRRRFARCRAALREILGRLLMEPPGSLRFRATGQGKPELDDRPAEDESHTDRLSVRFNVSHSADLALIAVSRGSEVGVDLERVRPIGEATRIVASFFSPAEQAEFAAIPHAAQPHAFHRGWTRKEALLKGLGVGIAGLAARHETGFGTTELVARFTPASPSPQVNQWMLWEAAPRTGFVAALAVCVGGAVVQPPKLSSPGPGASLSPGGDTP